MGLDLVLQDSRGSKRSVELLDCNQTQCGDEDDNDDAKRFKCTNNSRTLTREEKMQRRWVTLLSMQFQQPRTLLACTVTNPNILRTQT